VSLDVAKDENRKLRKEFGLPEEVPSPNEDGTWDKVNPHLKSIYDTHEQAVGFKPEATSTFRTQEEQDALPVAGKAPRSRHTEGGAFDQRIHNLTPDKIQSSLAFYNSQPNTTASIHNGNHIHVEYKGGWGDAVDSKKENKKVREEFGFKDNSQDSVADENRKIREEFGFTKPATPKPQEQIEGPIGGSNQLWKDLKAQEAIPKPTFFSKLKDEASSFIKNPIFETRPEHQQKPDQLSPEEQEIEKKQERFEFYRRQGFTEEFSREKAGLPPAGVWDDVKEILSPNMDKLGGISSPLKDYTDKIALRTQTRQGELEGQLGKPIGQTLGLPNRVAGQVVKALGDIGSELITPQNIAMAPLFEVPGAGRIAGAAFAPGMLKGAAEQGGEAYSELKENGPVAAIAPALKALLYGAGGALGAAGAFHEAPKPVKVAEAIDPPPVAPKPQLETLLPDEPLPRLQTSEKVVPDYQERAYRSVMKKLGADVDAPLPSNVASGKIIKNPEKMGLDALVEELKAQELSKANPLPEVPMSSISPEPVQKQFKSLKKAMPEKVASLESVQPVPQWKNVKEIVDSSEREFKGLKLDLFENKNNVTLSRIVVPKEMRNSGIGSKVLNDIVRYADSNGKTIGLSPTSDFGGSKPRLESFYKKLGFVKNAGKNKDFSIKESMVRAPRLAEKIEGQRLQPEPAQKINPLEWEALRSEIAGSQAGKRVSVEGEARGIGSSFPIEGLGSKKSQLAVIDKILKDKPLTEKQAEIKALMLDHIERQRASFEDMRPKEPFSISNEELASLEQSYKPEPQLEPPPPPTYKPLKQKSEPVYLGSGLGGLQEVLENKSPQPFKPLKQERIPIQEAPIEARPEIKLPKAKPAKGDAKLSSRVYERIQAEHPELKDNVSYNKMNLKADAERAVNLIKEDKAKAYRVAMGAEDSPHVTSTSANIAMAEKALEDGNHSLYSQLVKKRSLDQTRRGQEIVAEKGSVTDNATSRYVKELIKSRMENYESSYLKGIDDTLGIKREKKGFIKRLDREVEKATTHLKKVGKEFDMEAAQKLIDSLACK